MKLSKVIELEGLAGSEFRLWTTALLIANNILEDNAFTAKSFSEVSKLPLPEIVTMKMDFLELVGYDLDLFNREYMDWLVVLDTRYAVYTLRSLAPPPLAPMHKKSLKPFNALRLDSTRIFPFSVQ